MNDTYSTIEQAAAKPSSTKGNFVAEGAFDVQAWSEKKQEGRKAAFALIDQATERVSQDRGVYQDFLDTMAKVSYHYSPSNALLIFEQNPDASKVLDFEAWKREGQMVKRGERGIVILEPKDEYLKGDGSTGINFDLKYLYDIKQTNSRYLVPRYPELGSLINALVANSPASIQVKDELSGGAHAIFISANNTICISRGLDDPTIFKALALELSHAYLADGNPEYNRTENDKSARDSAYVLCRRFGVDPKGLEPTSAPGSEKDSLQGVREEIGSVRLASKEITTQMNKTLDANKVKTQLRGGRDGR